MIIAVETPNISSPSAASKGPKSFHDEDMITSPGNRHPAGFHTFMFEPGCIRRRHNVMVGVDAPDSRHIDPPDPARYRFAAADLKGRMIPGVSGLSGALWPQMLVAS